MGESPGEIFAWQSFDSCDLPHEKNRQVLVQREVVSKKRRRPFCSGGQVEEDKCVVLFREGRRRKKKKRLKFAAPTQPHEPLLPSDPTIPRFSIPPTSLCYRDGYSCAFHSLPATVKLNWFPVSSSYNSARLLFSRSLQSVACSMMSIFNRFSSDPITSHNCSFKK